MATAAIASTNKSTNVRFIYERGIRSGLRWLDRVAPELAAIPAERLFLSARRHARPEWESVVLASAARGSVAYAGKRLPTWSWGEGPTVLLLHGWEGRGSQLGAFVAPLVARGHRVLTLDMLGHGDAPRSPVSVVDFARVLAAIHGALGPVHGVIAHSVGGAALTMAYALSPFGERFAFIAAPRGPRRFFDGFGQALGLSASTRAAMEARISARYGLSIDEIDTTAYAPFMAAPALVVHDRGDREVPFENGQALAAALPDGRLLTTEGLGHRRILRDPTVVEAVSQFVSSPAARPLSARIDEELFDRALRSA